MTLEYETEKNQQRWEAAVKSVASILNLDPKKVGNYLVIAYDGSPELKADTDVDDIATLTAMVMVFLEHLSGKKVILGEWGDDDT